MTSPSDYRLILPEGWFRIDLEPGTREKAVAALADRQFRGADNAPHLKAEARRKLLAAADDAFRNGGIELYVSLQSALGFPLSAALAVTLTPPHELEPVMVAPSRLAKSLAGQNRHVGMIDLPAGGRSVSAVRIRRSPTWTSTFRSRAAAPICCCRSPHP